MIAREAIPFTLIGLALTVILFLLALKTGNWWVFGICSLMALVTLFATYFFRDPQRTCVDTSPGVIVAPADGKVIGIETVEDCEYLGPGGTKVSIFLSVFDVHVSRIPVTGTVDYLKYIPGKFFAAFEPKASELNERTEMGIVTPEGQQMIVKQIAGIIARRVVCRATEGQAVTAGDRYGLIRFGSRAELWLPSGCQVDVEIGDHVAGGETVMGHMSKANTSEKPDLAVGGADVPL